MPEIISPIDGRPAYALDPRDEDEVDARRVLASATARAWRDVAIDDRVANEPEGVAPMDDSEFGLTASLRTADSERGGELAVLAGLPFHHAPEELPPPRSAEPGDS